MFHLDFGLDHQFPRVVIADSQLQDDFAHPRPRLLRHLALPEQAMGNLDDHLGGFQLVGLKHDQLLRLADGDVTRQCILALFHLRIFAVASAVPLLGHRLCFHFFSLVAPAPLPVVAPTLR